MKKTFVVIGLGRFGFNVAKTLAEMNSDVLAIDVNEESVRNISKYVEHCVITDGTKFDALNELGVGQIDHAVVAIGNNLQASVLTVVNLKKLNVRLITVRADDVSQKELFYMLGATEVIIPEEASAVIQSGIELIYQLPLVVIVIDLVSADGEFTCQLTTDNFSPLCSTVFPS